MADITLCLVVKSGYKNVSFTLYNNQFGIVPKEEEFEVEESKITYIKVAGGKEVELYVADKTSGDNPTLKAYLESIANYYIKVEETESDAKTYNRLFSKINTKYTCVIKENVFLQQNWLIDLIYHYENIGDSGVIGITDSTDNLKCLPLFSDVNDCFINVFAPKDNYIYNGGVALFSSKLFFDIGYLDESIDLYENELNHFQLRCYYSGLYNYYIPTQNSIILKPELNYGNLVLSKKNMEESISKMKKNKQFFIPLAI